MVSAETSFREQFLDVPIRKGEPQIPADRTNNDLGFEVPPFEQRWPRFDHGIILQPIRPVHRVLSTQPLISAGVDGKIVGAIGVSGGTSQQDGQCAAAGAAAFK